MIVTNIKDYFPTGLRLLFSLSKERKDGHRVKLPSDGTDALAARLWPEPEPPTGRRRGCRRPGAVRPHTHLNESQREIAATERALGRGAVPYFDELEVCPGAASRPHGVPVICS